MPTRRARSAAERPTVDEWGLYDPQQAGLAALFTKLSDRPAPRAAAEAAASADATTPVLVPIPVPVPKRRG
ncbi:MAG: hypothetical protein IT178_08965 [Acidobacteria bacterium]|nr:hypothetical protein [Acidobacteriota bacterium]